MLVALCALFALAAGRASADAGERFAAGNAAYQEGRFEAAISAYQEALSAGGDPALYYNLGNAYLSAGKLGPAILAYERARARDPEAEDIAANLELALGLARERAAGAAFEAAPPPGGVFTPALAALAVYALAFALMTAGRIGRARAAEDPTRGRGGATALLLLGVAALLGALWLGGLAVYRATLAASDNRAVVTARSAPVRRGPLESAEALFSLPEGAIVPLEELQDGAGRLRLPGRPEGWVSLSEVEPIKQ